MELKRKLRLVLKTLLYLMAAYEAIPFFFKISIGLYKNFFSSSISFNLDTLFTNWNTTFPAVTVCEIYNGEKIWDISEQFFGVEHDLRLDDYVGEIVFFRGTCTTCETCDEFHCPENFTQLINAFRSKCDQLIINCSYINKKIDCCDKFVPLVTEYGICFAFNSNQARKVAQVEHANDLGTGPGSLQFDALSDIQLHVHAPLEVPFLYAEGIIRETLMLGSTKEIIVNVMEVHNHVSVEPLTIEQRSCRFDRERTEWGREADVYEFYSFSTCIVECAVAIHLEHCNCTSHLLANQVGQMPGSLPQCDYQGLSCLTAQYYNMMEKRKDCDCISPCEEPEYNIVYNSVDDHSEEDAESTRVKISLVELPTQRYVRRVTKNYLDLIISVGGIAGLFFNASLIRLVEIVFLLVEYKWSNLAVLKCKN